MQDCIPVYVSVLYGSVGERLMRVAQQMANGCWYFSVLPFVGLSQDLSCPNGTLLVLDKPSGRKDVHVLLSMGTHELKLGEDRCVLIPFGNGDSGLRAALIGIQMAKQLNLSVVFYHTTWRKPEVVGLASEDGWNHICDKALANTESLRELATSVGVESRFFIEIAAPTVKGGIIGAALRKRATMIVMARGSEIRTGSYVDQVAGCSPVPLFIV